jgi:hypothetical protein
MRLYVEKTTLAKVFNEKLEKYKNKSSETRNDIVRTCTPWKWSKSAHE